MARPQVYYRPPARLLHWVMAVLVLAMIPAGIVMTQKGIPKALQDGLFLFHKNTGVLILALVILRMIYRGAHPPPDLPQSVPEWQRQSARLSHATLYALLIVMPVSGYLRVVAGGFPIEMLDQLGVPRLVGKSETLANAAQAVHFYAHYVLIALVLLHISAALFHGLWRKDGVFQRMWPGASAR